LQKIYELAGTINDARKILTSMTIAMTMTLLTTEYLTMIMTMTLLTLNICIDVVVDDTIAEYDNDDDIVDDDNDDDVVDDDDTTMSLLMIP